MFRSGFGRVSVFCADGSASVGFWQYISSVGRVGFWPWAVLRGDKTFPAVAIQNHNVSITFSMNFYKTIYCHELLTVAI